MENTGMVAATAATAFKEKPQGNNGKIQGGNDKSRGGAVPADVLPPICAAPVTVYDLLPDTRLTPHFALREFVISATAVRHGIDNTPPADAVGRLTALCENVLEPLRRRFGVIRITSGYRCERVNRLVGGVPTSQHLRGEAADINVASRESGQRMYDYIRTRLDFDQLIFEQRRKTGTRWIHVSYRADGRNRRDARCCTV